MTNNPQLSEHDFISKVFSKRSYYSSHELFCRLTSLVFTFFTLYKFFLLFKCYV